MLKSFIIAILFSSIFIDAYAKNPVVLMKTNLGTMEIELFEKKAPVTVKNFLGYVKSGAYDGTIFHRVINDFIIQGGNYDVQLLPRTNNGTIVNEANNGLKNLKGTLAMARRVGKDTASNQFFINVKDNSVLDHVDKTDQGFGYAVFGKITKGYPVMEKINKRITQRRGLFPKLPVKNIIINSITLK